MTNPNQLRSWDQIRAVCPKLRDAFYQYLLDRPSAAFELEVVTGLRQSTVAGRFAELANTKGKYDWPALIFDSGTTRTNPETGRKCTVWNTTKPDDGQLDLFPDPDTPFFNEACRHCGIPADLHLGPDDALVATLHTIWGDRNRCRDFARWSPPRAAYGTI